MMMFMLGRMCDMMHSTISVMNDMMICSGKLLILGKVTLPRACKLTMGYTMCRKRGGMMDGVWRRCGMMNSMMNWVMNNWIWL